MGTNELAPFPLDSSLVELVAVPIVTRRGRRHALHDVDLGGADVGRAGRGEPAVHGGDGQVAPRRLDAPGAREQRVLDPGVVGGGELAVALGELAAHHHVLEVAGVGVQDDGGDGVDPAEQRGGAAVVHQEVGDGARGDDADVVAAQGLAAGAGGEQEGLVDGHGVVGGDGALLQDVEVQLVAGVLEPDAGLGGHVGRVGEEGVDAQGHLVLDAVVDAGLVRVAVVHLGLGRVGEVLVARVQQLGVLLRHEGAVREDDGDAVVEEAQLVEQLGAVADCGEGGGEHSSANGSFFLAVYGKGKGKGGNQKLTGPRTSQVVGRHGGDVVLPAPPNPLARCPIKGVITFRRLSLSPEKEGNVPSKGHNVGRLLAVGVGVEGVVGHGGRDEGVLGGHVGEDLAEVGQLLGHAEVGHVVEGVGPEDAGAAVDRRLEPRARRLVGPGVVRVVERRRRARVERLVQARQLPDVDVVGRHVVARHELAEPVEVLGQRRVGGDGLEARLPAVAVRVDEAGRDDLARAVDHLVRRVVGGRGDGRALLVDAGDTVVLDQHGPVAHDVEGLAGLVEGDDGTARKENRRSLGGGHEGGEDSSGLGGHDAGLVVWSWLVLPALLGKSVQ